MDSRAKFTLTALILSVGALILLGLTVYPFQYGWVESSILAGGFVLAALFQTVLDGAFAGG